MPVSACRPASPKKPSLPISGDQLPSEAWGDKVALSPLVSTSPTRPSESRQRPASANAPVGDLETHIRSRSLGASSPLAAHCSPPPQTIPSAPIDRTVGPLSWDLRRSAELQRSVDALSLENVLGIEFSLTVADPKLPDCPLVACSTGFSKLTHYTMDEIIGKNCRFLLQGVPPELVEESVRIKCRGFCREAADGTCLQKRDEDLPDGLKQEKPFVKLGDGEILCVQTNAKKTGELFRNMFYLKAVDLDDSEYIVGLQAGLEESFDDVDLNCEGAKIREACAGAFRSLDQNMSSVEEILASSFCYISAPRRY